MAKRKKNHSGFRTAQAHTSLRVGQQPGTYEVTLALRSLPAPEDEFYANTAYLRRRPNYATFVFVQFAPGTITPRNIVGVDLPYRALPALLNSIDDGFRAQMSVLTKDLAGLDEVEVRSRDVQVVSRFAHLARIMVNELGGMVDFYEMEPSLNEARPVNAVIRIKSLPAVTAWFVDALDELMKNLEPLSSVQVDTAKDSESSKP